VKKNNSHHILKQNLDDLLEAKKWLVHSYEVCESLMIKGDFSVSEYDAIESFLSRYARVCDLLLRTKSTIDAICTIVKAQIKTN